jgi:hypothetical protein
MKLVIVGIVLQCLSAVSFADELCPGKICGWPIQTYSARVEKGQTKLLQKFPLFAASEAEVDGSVWCKYHPDRCGG